MQTVASLARERNFKVRRLLVGDFGITEMRQTNIYTHIRSRNEIWQRQKISSVKNQENHFQNDMA